MASPTFDGNALFDCSSMGPATTWGILQVGSYETMKIDRHFNGEVGSRRQPLGTSNQKWAFMGNIFAPSSSALDQIFAAIETYIDADPSDPAQYKSLTDSFGNSWSNAFIERLHKGVRQYGIFNSPGGKTPGFIAVGVVVEGILSGMQHSA